MPTQYYSLPVENVMMQTNFTLGGDGGRTGHRSTAALGVG